uniref:Takeout/JHBP-like protein n=1 Tax=Diploptera punctata TaxID=6984 RepID=A4ZVL2_DIPPU|nr:takeout/JHBP-like protein [Diploptera punctata]
MRGVLLLALLYCGATITTAAKLPDTFLKCKRTDYENVCLKHAVEKALKAMKNGIPSLQLLPIDPLAVTKISIEEGANQPITVKLDLLNAELTGLYGVEVVSASYNLSQRIFDVEVFLPSLNLVGDYDMDGKFLLLPLKGKGKCNLTLSKFKANFLLKARDIKKKNDIYWDITSITLGIHDVSNFHVNFENLFNGDKALGDTTNKALNDNWEEFWGVIRPSIEQAFGDVFAHVANIIFSRVPEKNLFMSTS